MAITILIVDDDPLLCRLFATSLANNGYTVHTVQSGAVAIQILQNADIDLIVMDVMMADMDGIDTVSQIRLTWNAPIIMLSARTDGISKLLSLNAGATTYLFKPITPERLVKHIEETLNK